MTVPVDVVMPGDGADVLRASTLVPDATPAETIAAFLDPDLVRRWWGGGELTVDPEVGGRYVVAFARLGQTMRGEVTELDAAGRLAFTWSWDHEPPAGTRTVTVTAASAGGGCRLDLVHGPYPGGADGRAEAEGHRDGWQHFLPGIAPALAAARAG